MLPTPTRSGAAALRRPAVPGVSLPAWLPLAGAIATTILLWGGAFVAIRATLPSIEFASLASGRLLIAALTFAALARPLGVRRLRRQEIPAVAVLGLTGYTGYQLLLSAGERTVPAGTSALIFAAAPVMATALSWPVLGERIGRRGWAGLAVALAGAALTAAGEGASSGAGAGIALVAAGVTLYAFWVVLQKRALRRLRAIDMTVWATWFGAAFSLPFSTGLPHALATAPPPAILGLLALGLVVTTVPFLLWSWTLSRLGASTAAPLLLLIGPAALLLGWAFLGEVPAPAALAGGAITLAGVAGARPVRSAR
jgi:drug/metabolite transporter (DMT)-like permease